MKGLAVETPGRLLEHVILHQVRREQWRAAGVERLEDDCGVVGGGQVDHDELKQREQHRLQPMHPPSPLAVVGGGRDPLVNLQPKELVRPDNA